MWASETVVYFGFLRNFAGAVNRRKRRHRPPLLATQQSPALDR